MRCPICDYGGPYCTSDEILAHMRLRHKWTEEIMDYNYYGTGVGHGCLCGYGWVCADDILRHWSLEHLAELRLMIAAGKRLGLGREQ